MVADGALALDEAIGKKGIVLLDRTEWLARLALFNKTVLPEV